MKKALCLVLAVLLVSSLAGCNPTVEFSCVELTMRVPESMTDVSASEDNAMFTFALESETLFLCGIREDLLSIPDGAAMTLEDYAHTLIEDNGMTDVTHEQREDYIFLRFQLPLEDGVHQYLCGVFRSPSAFWLIQMDALTADFDEETCFSYLDSVVFK